MKRLIFKLRRWFGLTMPEALILVELNERLSLRSQINIQWLDGRLTESTRDELVRVIGKLSDGRNMVSDWFHKTHGSEILNEAMIRALVHHLTEGDVA